MESSELDFMRDFPNNNELSEFLFSDGEQVEERTNILLPVWQPDFPDENWGKINGGADSLFKTEVIPKSCTVDKTEMNIEIPQFEGNIFSGFGEEKQGAYFVETGTGQITSSSIKKSKGRPKKNMLPDEYKKFRQKQNRESAKLSRNKKKLHFQSLEDENKRLKAELHKCYERLRVYETIERRRNSTALSTEDTVSDVEEEVGTSLSKKKKVLEELKEKEASTKSQLIERYHIEVAERMALIEELAHMMIEVLLPFPHKYLLWAASNGRGLFNGDTGCALPKGESLPIPTPDILKVRESQEHFIHCSNKLRKNVQEFFNNIKVFHDEVKEIHEYCLKTILPNINFGSVQIFLNFLEKIKTDKELSDEKIFNFQQNTMLNLFKKIHQKSRRNSRS